MGRPRPGGRAGIVDDRGQGAPPCPGPCDDDHGVLRCAGDGQPETLNELDRQLTISPIGAGWPPSWPTPEWASLSPGTSRATAATSERAPLVQKSGLGAGPGHPEPRRERARNSIPSKTIMPLDS